MSEPLEDIKGVLLDLDGTIFIGDRLVPGAADAVDALRRGGLPLRFGTNTTRMSRTALVDRLKEMGLELEPGEVFTAPLAAASWLEKKGPLELISVRPRGRPCRLRAFQNQRDVPPSCRHRGSRRGLGLHSSQRPRSATSWRVPSSFAFTTEPILGHW